MMRWMLVGLLLVGLATPAQATVTDWPVIGQVVRVGTCVVGGAGSLVISLLSHLGQWGSEAIARVGHCALETAEEVTDVAVDLVSLEIPTPDAPITEVVDEVPTE